MTTSAQVIGSKTPVEDAAIKGLRRSRFSLHLNSRRVRRWLLVQFVSVPVEEAVDEQLHDTYTAQKQATEPKGIKYALDEYCTRRMMQRYI